MALTYNFEVEILSGSKRQSESSASLSENGHPRQSKRPHLVYCLWPA